MIVTSTNLKNNLGKYLRLSAREEIIITSNGRKIAKLSAYDRDQATSGSEPLKEEAKAYELTPRKALYEEFLKLAEESEERYEYINGEIFLLSSPKAFHQKILGKLHFIFYNYFQGKVCQPFLAPFVITLKRSLEDINVVQPDLMVICDLEKNLNEKGYYLGVPALVVEVLSESSRSKDLIKKLDLYMSTGIREYWVVNPLNKEVSVYLFAENNISQNVTYKDQEAAVSYNFTGLEVSLERIFS